MTGRPNDNVIAVVNKEGRIIGFVKYTNNIRKEVKEIDKDYSIYGQVI